MTAARQWWCPICNASVDPSWLGGRGRVAYHQFGRPPFVARHAIFVRQWPQGRAPAGIMPA